MELIIFILALVLLIIALGFDLLALYTEIIGAIRGEFVSGTPFSFFIYYALANYMHQSFIFSSPGDAFSVFILFHILCEYCIPVCFRIKQAFRRWKA